MLVLAVKGSPRAEGKTNRFIDEYLRGVSDAGNEIKIYDIGNKPLLGCQACYVCKQTVTDCVIDDELKDYFSDLHTASALIVGAPNYASSVCGQMVSFMNRHYSLINEDRSVRIPSGIKVTGVFAQGQQDKEKYIENYRWFMSDFTRRHMELQDIIVLTSADDEAKMLAQAYEMGLSLFA